MNPPIRVLAALATSLFALCVYVASTYAGANANAVGTLTWSSSAVVSNLVPSGGTRRLYVRLQGLASFRAVEVRVLWAPTGIESPAYDLTSWGAPPGSNCTWLLRGTVTSIPGATDSSLHLAANGSLVNTSCSNGNALYLDFADPPSGAFPPGRFRLASVRVTDANNQVDELTVGPPATILSGTAEPAPLIASQFPSTGWVGHSTTYRITGFNLVAPTQIQLTKPGRTPLLGTIISASDRKQDVQFSFAAPDTGRWNLVTTNPGGRATKLGKPTHVVVENGGGTGLSGGTKRLIVHLAPGALPLTGPRAIPVTDLAAGDASLRSALSTTGVRKLQCLWPEAVPQRSSVRRPDGTDAALHDFGNYFELSFDTHEAALSALTALRGHALVRHADLSHSVSGLQCNLPPVTSCGAVQNPDDPDYFISAEGRGQWDLHQGFEHEQQFGGRINEDLQSDCAWLNPIARGNRSVVIGICDSGIDVNHTDLNRTYSNPTWGQKILPGFNFVDGNTNVADGYGHGTFVAGLAAARTANGTSYTVDGFSRGIAGVAGGWAQSGIGTGPDSAGARILPVRFIDDFNFGTFGGLVSSINWAAQQGADIINLSVADENVAGLPPDTIDPSLRHALYNALQLGATCIAAMGNNNDQTAQYPARYAEWGLCTAVGATDLCGYRVDLGGTLGSSFGPHLDVVAPGLHILGTIPLAGGNLFFPPGSVTHYGESLFGTSWSCALVSGTAASLRGMNPVLDDVDIKNILRETADNTTSSPAIEVGRGRVNHSAAVRLIDPALGGAVVSQILDSPTTHEIQNGVPLTIRSSDIVGVPDQTYTVNRHELRFTTTFPVAFTATPKAWVRVGDTKGWSSANPHFFNYGGGEVVSLTATQATFKTFVYFIPSLSKWVPNTPALAKLSYRAAGMQSGTTGVPEQGVPDQLAVRILENPARASGIVVLSLNARAGTPVVVSLHGVAGREIARRSAIGTAELLMRLDLRQLNGRGDHPPAGVYFVRARQGNQAATARFVLVP